MRYCTFCGTQLPEHAQFCGYCGHLSMLTDERSLPRAVPSSTWSLQDELTIINEQKVPYPQQEERTLLTPRNNATWTPPISSQLSAEEEQDRMRRMVWGVDVPLAGAAMSGSPSVPVMPVKRHNRRLQTRPAPGAVKGAVTRWIILVVTAVLVLAAAGVSVVLAVSPSLSLEGGLSENSAVVPGQHLSLRGRGFLPDGHVTLKRDRNQIVQVAAQNSMMAARKDVSPDMITLSTVSLPTSTDVPVMVSTAGTFDVSLLVGKDWGPGEHTLRATEDIFSRSATMLINVDDAPAKLSVAPPNLNFGSLEKGTKTTLSLSIGNTGGKPLDWSAATSGANWLKLQPTSGGVLPDGGPQSLNVSCDTTSLAPGTYSAITHVYTNGGNSDVKVLLHVVAQKQAQLAVSTAALDFQTMYTGQQATKVISISSTGEMELNWQVTSNENWVSLAPTSGFIRPGAAQSVDVQVDTTELPAGNYSATLTVGSNGGAAHITVFLVVSAALSATPTSIPPTPILTQAPLTPTPTQMPQGSLCRLPSSLDFGQVTPGQTATQSLSLGNCGNASFAWRAQPGDTWVAVANTGSTLDPDTTTPINVAVNTAALNSPGTYKSTLTFYTSVGNQTVHITVTIPEPTPSPTASPNVIGDVSWIGEHGLESA